MSGDRWGDTARDRAAFDAWLTTDPREFDDDDCPCGGCESWADVESCRDLGGWPREGES